jgi:predicted RND superfamily exporter protein
MFDFLIKAGLIIFVGIPLAFIAFWVAMMIIGIPVRIYYAIDDYFEERKQKQKK